VPSKLKTPVTCLPTAPLFGGKTGVTVEVGEADDLEVADIMVVVGIEVEVRPRRAELKAPGMLLLASLIALVGSCLRFSI
tara:strand:+ start:265 stop:504 length:240 start_codon:yes stop_codon:yes gene_type:complete